MSAKLVRIEQPELGITMIELNRPNKLNAFTAEMMVELRAALMAANADKHCRVIVLASAGRGFCAGLDLKEITGTEAPNTALNAMALQELFAGTPALMRRIRQPIVAAVQGVAVGAGFALALAADVRVASTSAKFLIGAVRIGLTAGETGISFHLPRIIGAGRAFEIMLTGRPVSAAEANAIGLVTELVEEVEQRSTAIAKAIAENSPYATKHTKQLMWTNLDVPSLDAALQLESHAQTVAMLSHDFTEATQAFVEKRPPRFTGS